MKIKWCDIPAVAIAAAILVLEIMIFVLFPQTVEAKTTDLGNFKLTFYCPCRKCSGKYGHSTASGAYATEGRTIAVDPRVIPLGSTVYIEGWGEFLAEDTGGSWVRGNHIDVFLEDHGTCIDSAHGVKRAEVYLLD